MHTNSLSFIIKRCFFYDSIQHVTLSLVISRDFFQWEAIVS